MNTFLAPYLNFDGNCGEAMEYYHSILGGTLNVQTFADAFPDTAEEKKSLVMHASLEVGDVQIMASDTDPEYSQPLEVGNNVHLSLVGSDEATLRTWFEKLSEGGSVQMPLEKQFWGDIFGMLTDKFGVHWMVNISPSS